MPPGSFNNNQREAQRFALNLSIEISLGPQITLKGQLKDLSFKSAFIKIKHSIYLQINDELDFTIYCSATNAKEVVQGSARVSRIAVGEGIAIYFMKMDDGSISRLKKLLNIRA